jgi:hypothetical protein
MENAMLNYMGEHVKIIIFKLRSLLGGGFEGTKYDSEA